VPENGGLLDISQQTNGSILEVERHNLRDAGTGMNNHAEAIFNTTFRFVTPEEGSNVHFTTTMDAFYILVLAMPNADVGG
jgi:alpha-L-fucosidase